MAGTKVSQLEFAVGVDSDDLLYIVNNGAPRKIKTADLAEVVRVLSALVKKVNGVAANAAGEVTITKQDIGLGNVPNISPVSSVNSASGDITIIPKVGGGLSVSNNQGVVELAIDPTYEFTWDNISGDPVSNQQLATILAGVGVLTNPLTLDTAPYIITAEHTKTMWVNVASPTDVLVELPILDIAVGSVLELRQSGLGTVGITFNNQYMAVNVPTGSVTHTAGMGTRIQLVYLGLNSWEFR